MQPGYNSYGGEVSVSHLIWGRGWLQTTVAHAGVSCPLHGYFDIHIKDRLGKASYLSVQWQQRPCGWEEMGKRPSAVFVIRS